MLQERGYFGNKKVNGLYQAIISIMPAHITYMELFLGSGQIMKLKPPSFISIGSDLDDKLLVKSDYEGLPNLTLLNQSAFEILSTYDFDGNELVYLDPPYPHETRSSKRYKHELSDSDHKQLCQLVNSINTSIIISTYPNKIYSQYLKSWRFFDLQVMTRGGVRTERVYYNFDITSCFSCIHSGLNFTDRQRIKRKADRWLRKYELLPIYEQQAIINSLLSISDRS